MSLSTVQRDLLSYLYRYGGTRTNILASAYGRTPPVTAQLLLLSVTKG